MAKLNTILGVLTAVLAIAAAGLSYKLFEQRAGFVDRADRLAATVTGMVAALEADSGLSLQEQVSFTAADADSGTPASGALSFAGYKNADSFDAALTTARTLAADVSQQRKQLASGLATVSTQLGMPEGMAPSEDLANLADPTVAETALTRALQLSGAVQERDQAMIGTLMASARVVKATLDAAALTTVQQVQAEDGSVALAGFASAQPLQNFENRVIALNTRCDDYGKTLVEGIERVKQFDWKTAPDTIQNEDAYEGALLSLRADYDGLDQELLAYERAQEQLRRTREQIAELTDEVEDLQGQITQGRIDPRRPEGPGETELLDDPMNLEGHVLEVNREWNFVILDLGRKEQVTDDMQLLVARAEKLVARLQISKVLGTISIGEVLPAVQTAEVQVGDRVILPANFED